MTTPLSVQLYSVRDDFKNDPAGTLARVGKMGYDAVEFAGYAGKSAAELRKMLDDAGLKCSGAHVGLAELEGDKCLPTAEFHQALGCNMLIVPGIDVSLRNNLEVCKRTAERFTAVALKLAPHKLRTGFHLHSADIAQLPDHSGTTAWDHFARNTPREFILQFDTGNAMHGNADPVKPILDYPGRSASVHLKEFPLDGRAIGMGQVPWPSVFDACRRAGGTEVYVVETENYARFTPMEAIAACLGAVRAMGR